MAAAERAEHSCLPWTAGTQPAAGSRTAAGSSPGQLQTAGSQPLGEGEGRGG